VERLQALPDASTPPAAVAEAPVRSLFGAQYARRIVMLASAVMLATLLLALWHVPRLAAPVPTSPPLQGPPVSLERPPEKSVAPASPVPPPSGLSA